MKAKFQDQLESVAVCMKERFSGQHGIVLVL